MGAAESAASCQMTPTPSSRTPPHRLSSDASFKMLIPIQPPAVPMMVSTARGSFFGSYSDTVLYFSVDPVAWRMTHLRPSHVPSTQSEPLVATSHRHIAKALSRE